VPVLVMEKPRHGEGGRRRAQLGHLCFR
jgi:hypothetical protein